MSVLRVKKSNNFVVIHKGALEDPNLSFKAKGLWTYCMSRPDDWVFHVSHLATISKDGEDAIYSAIKELIKFGYVKRLQPNNGRFETMDYEVYETPQIQKKFAQPENQRAEVPLAGDPALLSIDICTKNNNNKPAEDVVVFSKESFQKAAEKCGIDTERIERAWKVWHLKADKGKALVRNPIAWLIDCARKNYLVPEEIINDNLHWLKKIECMAEQQQKSHLLHINSCEGYIIFTDCPSVTYNVKDRDFLLDVSIQMNNRGIIF